MVSSTTTSTGSDRITLSGFASGIDTKALIDALIAVEQRPILIAQDRLDAQTRRKASVAQVNSSVANLLAKAAALRDTSIVGAKTATTNQPTGQSTSLSVSASASAATGSFNVDVVSLATNTKVQSTGATGQAVSQNTALASAGFTTPVTTGTFSINGTSFTIDSSTVLSNGVNSAGQNTILAKINNAGLGVTASIVNDADGRANLLQLTSASTVQVGGGGDTSNFLAAAHLLESPGTTTRTSARGMGGTDTGAFLQNARLATALTANSGSFQINGVTINWDATADSMSGVISRINSSAANVTASWDSVADRLVLVSKDTGSANIQLTPVSGNFLTSTRVLTATQTLGANASYRIDSGALQYSASNTVTDAVAGVTLTLQGTTTSSVAVTVATDNAQIRSRIQGFVEQYNSTMNVIHDATKYVQGGTNGPLFGDSMLRGLQSGLRSLITGPATGTTGNLNALTALGLNFGAVGSAVGTTDTLAFDGAKFDAAVADNPDGVRTLLAGFSASSALNPGGTGSIASISGRPTAVTDSGKYTITSTNTGQLTVTFAADNGSTPVVSTGTLTAGGTNTTLIPGVTVTAKGALVNGTDTITITATQEGAGKAIHEYLDGFTRAGGLISQRTDELQANMDDINKQIDTMNKRVAAKREQLTAKFAQLEVTMQRLQGQQAQVGQLASALGNKA